MYLNNQTQVLQSQTGQVSHGKAEAGLWKDGTLTTGNRNVGRTWTKLKILTARNASISLSFPWKKPLIFYLMKPDFLCLETCN